jgi:hypothetical protein
MDNIFNILQNINSIQNRNGHINQLLQLTQKSDVALNKLAPGIRNHGLTCFHNSAIQMLFRITELKNNLISQNSLTRFNGTDVYNILKLLKKMNDESDSFNKIKDNPINEKELILTGICPFIKTDMPSEQERLKQSLGIKLTKMINELIKDCHFESQDEPINKNDETIDDVMETIKQSYDDSKSQILIDFLYNQFCASNTLDIDKKKYLYLKLRQLRSEINPYTHKQYDAQEFIYNAIGFISTEKYVSDFLGIRSQKYYCKIRPGNDTSEAKGYIYELKNDYKKCLNPSEWRNKGSERSNIYTLKLMQDDNRSVNEILYDTLNPPIEKIIEALNQNNVVGIGLGKDDDGINHLYFERYILNPSKYLIMQLNIDSEGTKIKYRGPLGESGGVINIYTDTNEVRNYKLIGFIVHKGEILSAGHYISYIENNAKWYKYNDSVVEEINVDPIWKYAYEKDETPSSLLYCRI